MTNTTTLEGALITIRHRRRMRRLTVAAVERPTPRLARITLDGPDLRGFTSLAADDHVKVVFPARRGEDPVLPVLGEGGRRRVAPARTAPDRSRLHPAAR